MTKACLALAFFCLVFVPSLRAYDWETATANGRDYVTLRSFCAFYHFSYEVPGGNYFSSSSVATSDSPAHSIRFKLGNSDIYLDGVHYVMSFPIESGDHDWLVSRMDVIKLFDPILRPSEISDRHAIRGVVIDPGHGGSDNGAASSLGYEKNYTLETAFILEGILRAAGLRTVLTRRTDVFVDLYERAHIASLYPDYAFVSIHYNSAEAEAHGLETYCLAPRGAASTSSAYLSRADIYRLPGNDYDAQNILLASLVHSEIIRLNPGDTTADRGVKRARFVVIKQNVLPAILVEGGFLSNHLEARRVDRDDYRRHLAEAIARGVIRFANVMGDRNIPLPEETTPPPRAIPVTPPPAQALGGQSSSNTTTATTSTTSHKPKKKKTAATPANVNNAVKTRPQAKPAEGGTVPSTPSTAGTAPPPASTPPTVPAVTPVVPAAGSPPTSATPSGPLNLNEPAPPAPASVPDKPAGAAEPDEPPTVSIYPTMSATNASPPVPPPSPSTNPPASPSTGDPP
jgi:N-acetylmuramoyl-L-alanine amidase